MHWWQKREECTGCVLVVLWVTSCSYEGLARDCIFYSFFLQSVIYSTIPLSIHSKQLDYSLFFWPNRTQFPQKQTSVTLLLDPWQKTKQTFWGFNLSSCLQYAVGVGLGLEMETNPVWNGPWGQFTRPVQKENISHTEKNPMSPGSAGEKPNMLLPQVAVDSTSIYCPLIIFFSMMRYQQSQLGSQNNSRSSHK